MKREVSRKTAFLVIAVLVLLIAGYGIYYFSAGQRPEQVTMPTPPAGVPPQLGLPGQPMGAFRQGQGGQPIGSPQVAMPMPRQVMPLQMGAPGQMGGMQPTPSTGMPGSSR